MKEVLVLMSIKPKYCELIASGKKTIEIRKTKPKIVAPFKCYIYCTKSNKHFFHNGIGESLDDLYRLPNGEIKHGCSLELMCCDKPYNADNFLNGKVIGAFVCDKIFEIPPSFEYYSDYYDISDDTLDKTRLTMKDLHEYGNGKTLYGWHISDIKIYDRPKELRDFFVWKKCNSCRDSGYESTACCYDVDCKVPSVITRPPQSWCYVGGTGVGDSDECP